MDKWEIIEENVFNNYICGNQSPGRSYVLNPGIRRKNIHHFRERPVDDLTGSIKYYL
jgi:hypothetical protein